MEQRGLREQLVIATKYTTDYRRGQPGQHSAFVGNSAKSLHNSHSRTNTAEDSMLVVQVWCRGKSDEELRSYGGQMKGANSETASKIGYIPLVLGPELAMARMPAPVKRSSGWISSSLFPSCQKTGQTSLIHTTHNF